MGDQLSMMIVRVEAFARSFAAISPLGLSSNATFCSSDIAQSKSSKIPKLLPHLAHDSGSNNLTKWILHDLLPIL